MSFLLMSIEDSCIKLRWQIDEDVKLNSPKYINYNPSLSLDPWHQDIHHLQIFIGTKGIFIKQNKIKDNKNRLKENTM